MFLYLHARSPEAWPSSRGRRESLNLIMIKILQINVDRKRVAHDVLAQTASHLGADLILVAEPNKTISRGTKWFTDKDQDVGIIKGNPGVRITKWGSGKGFVWVRVQGMCVFSVYVSPNCLIRAFESFLQGLQSCIRSTEGMVVIGGDFNSKSPMWGDPREDERGRILTEWVSSLSLCVLNEG